MTDRFSVLDLLRGHWKGLRNRTYGKTVSSKRDLGAVSVLLGVPLIVLVAALWRGWKLSDSEALLNGVSLLVGGLLAAFGQMAAWRARLTRRRDGRTVSDRPARDSIDEAVAHILWAVFISLVELVLLVIAANTTDAAGSSPAALSAFIYAAGTYLLLLLLLVLPKLYQAYDKANDLDDEMSGFAS